MDLVAAAFQTDSRVSTTMALLFVVVVGLVIVALTAKTRRMGKRGEHPKVRKAGERGRREFQARAAVVIQRHLDELPPEPVRTRLSMDMRDRVDLAGGERDRVDLAGGEADAVVDAGATEVGDER